MGILDALFNRGPGNADADEFPLDSDERADAARAVASTTMSPSDVIADYGDGNDDHSSQQHHDSWYQGEGGKSVENWYDKYQPEDIQIL